jgi:hypothetical protein
MLQEDNVNFAAFIHQSLLSIKCFIAKTSLYYVDLGRELDFLRVIFNVARN